MGVRAGGVTDLCCRLRILVLQEVVGHLRRPGHFTRMLQTWEEQIKDQAIILEDECEELEL